MEAEERGTADEWLTPSPGTSRPSVPLRRRWCSGAHPPARIEIIIIIIIIIRKNNKKEADALAMKITIFFFWFLVFGFWFWGILFRWVVICACFVIVCIYSFFCVCCRGPIQSPVSANDHLAAENVSNYQMIHRKIIFSGMYKIDKNVKNI